MDNNYWKEFEKEYDETDPLSIENYAQKLIGRTFADIVKESAMIREASNYYNQYDDSKRKGRLGELIEECFFHYQCNNDSKPDFDKAGVELKVTPYRVNNNKTLSAKERLIITMIDYCKVIDESFEESHMWEKSKLILLVYYLFDKEMESRLDYEIGFAKLFTPPEKDQYIIRQDFEKIVAKIRAGKAHELSEGDTLYLGAAPKAATSKNRRKQPFSDELAKPRAFAFKNSYMTYVLNNYIVPGKQSYEPIMEEVAEESFEDYVVNKLHEYKGWSVTNLCRKFNVDFEKCPKNLGAMLAYRILGVRGNHAEEFEKANVALKTIRISSDNKIRENMSFPTFKFKELVGEEWETSTFYTYLSETRFLFVVYKFDKNKELYLEGCQFWNIPYKDLSEEVHSVWEKTRQVLCEGLHVTEKNGKHYNNFPKSSENRVSHVRPHALNAKDTYELPDGRLYPKQCFWLNNSYILEQLDEGFLGRSEYEI
ncbi:Sau3AI family type II restriction endonuclease [Parasporobacterium paucivorans]|uniref:DNA mismatch repair protein MutH n=1 Tax=Parasporobacterium paucivorans DSM 15970 TaxID=1122934 RepID=A0A1M6J764_9FIRM|nr:Sau3AI family type II restriction endonuclease [Parasporobacterium paucivorans]SHJ42467.1 DNA mismatch repair protein MutH [Parasporobacterium paucivorans DSM 15970]